MISSVLGLFFLLMYLYPVARITRGLVSEKELRLREICLMMGNSKAALFHSWFIVTLAQMVGFGNFMSQN